jgi:hypothetical protein
MYSASLRVCRFVLLLLRQRRGAAGNGLGLTIKYLRRTTNGAAGNALGARSCFYAAQRVSAWIPRSSTYAAPRALA